MTVKIDGSNGLLANYDYQTPTTGFTYTFTTYNVLFANPAGTLATGTVTMSANPVDGTMVTITSTQQITALTINANTGQSIVGGGAIQLNANTNRQYMYRAANTTWYLVNVAAGNVVTSVNGATGAVTFTNSYVGERGQVFTGNGTFTIPTGVTAVKVTVVGGGGGGGGGRQSCCGSAGGGGGGGAALIKYLTGLTPGNTLSVTVGAAGAGSVNNGSNGSTGGTSSVASGTQSITTLTCTGGGAGPTQAPNNRVAGGTATNGDINADGGPCHNAGGNGSAGGNSGLGFGLGGFGATGASNGTYAGTGYGGGGGGGYSFSGGAGTAGVVIFEW